MEKKYRLPRKFVEDWCKELRSGKYKQGQGMLFEYDTKETPLGYLEIQEESEGSYCCLGVAGIVCGYDREVLDDRAIPADISEERIDDHLFPDALLTSVTGDDEIPENLVLVLTSLNDGLNFKTYLNYDFGSHWTFHRTHSDVDEDLKYSFEEIAQFIEENVETYDEEI